MKDELWEHMNNEHNLLLLDSELADIRDIKDSENKGLKIQMRALQDAVNELQSKLKEIDDELAIIEDTVKGLEGDVITKIRAKISNLKP